LLEQRLRGAGGRQAYQRSFLVHYLEGLIYWNVPQWALIAGSMAVVVVNAAYYSVSARQNRAGRVRA
jgi:hypothetical protein